MGEMSLLNIHHWFWVFQRCPYNAKFTNILHYTEKDKR